MAPQQKQFRAKAVEVIYPGHVNAERIFSHLRSAKYGLYKAFVKWHNGDKEQPPHTHVGLILRDTPRLDMAGHAYRKYFDLPEVVEVVAISPSEVQALGKGNSSPLKKLARYVRYITDGHDNGRWKDSWNYKYDYRIECAKDWTVKAYIYMQRGKTFDEIFSLADDNGQCDLIDNHSKITARWGKYKLMKEKQLVPPTLRPWQQEALTRLENQDDRKVLWICNKKGNIGKSFFCKYLAIYKGACAFENAKTADIAHLYKGQEYACMNLTRQSEGYINYKAIEALKDANLFSPKYNSESKMRGFHDVPVKLLVVANCMPEMEGTLTEDRWDIQVIE